jgi:hypothetical protein
LNLLEEFGSPYTAHTIDITKDEQFAPDFLKISPHNMGGGLSHPRGRLIKDLIIHSDTWLREQR